MQGVRVTFQLRMPMVVPSTDKPLDTVMSWAAVRMAQSMDVDDPFAVQHDIGIAKHGTGDDWCFMASNMEIQWSEIAAEQLHYIKRQSVDQYLDPYMQGLFKKKPSIDTSRGHTAAASLFQHVRWVKQIQAWAVVDDMERFKEVLHHVTHIGKLHHKDWGAVQAVVVDADESAHDRWMFRSLPMASPLKTANHVSAIGALNSPYWDRQKHREIAVFAG